MLEEVGSSDFDISLFHEHASFHLPQLVLLKTDLDFVLPELLERSKCGFLEVKQSALRHDLLSLVVSRLDELHVLEEDAQVHLLELIAKLFDLVGGATLGKPELENSALLLAFNLKRVGET